MSNEFDLERAKAGEPIEYPTGKTWDRVKFIGDWNDHDVVCEVPWSYAPTTLSKAALRMAAPEPVKVRYRAYLSRDNDGEISASTTNDRHGYISTVVVERLPGFVQWIHTEWQEVEVPQ
jgi:hypothetical protein